MHVYETTHPVAHSAEEMFALVANVEDYPKFLPLCEELKVTRREEREGRDVLVATMTVGYGMIHESFTTRGASRPRRAAPSWSNISTGRSRFLENRWRFQPTGARRLRGRVLYRLCLPLAPVRAAGGRAVRARRSSATPAPSRRAPMWSMAETDVASRLTAMSSSRLSARSTLRRLISPRPRSPNSTPLVHDRGRRAGRRRNARARPASPPCRRRARRCR